MYISPDHFLWLREAEEQRRLRDLEHRRVALERAHYRSRRQPDVRPSPAS